MPYKVSKVSNTYIVRKKDNNKIIGIHNSKKKANAQIRAIYANEKR